MKPLRGKRVGPAQSARRIQPGQSRSAGAGFGGSSPPPPLRPPGARPRGRAGGGGSGAGTAARPTAGPGRAHFLRGGAPRPAPGRLGRPPAGRWPGAARAAAGVRAPGQQRLAESRGRGRGPPPRPPPPPSAAPWRGASLRRRPRSAARRPRGCGGRARRPPAPLSTGADCPQCAPTARRRRAGLHGPRRGARGPRRCRLPTRPVLKHGPRSLARARVRGLESKARGAMKVRAGARRLRWDPGARPSRLAAPGAPPARLARRPARGAGEVERERPC